MKAGRRKFMNQFGLTTIALSGIVPTASLAQKDLPDSNGQVLYIGDNIALAKTVYGTVRGFILRGIYTFRGIPYGADTSGVNRFMPPQKPTPWTDVYPAVWWGNSAPQNMDRRYANLYNSFVDHWNYDDVSEDCLKLNIWTPALDGKKRPVLVWLHGGGYTNGNAIEQDGYYGENLSRKNDVVFVSINHRLGPLGYAHFGGAGARFAASGNVGMLDCIAALEWVRDNIEQFGGDPGSVTIMGQSGGGAKVCVLTAMPAAKGLFHRAVVLSGASLRAMEKEQAEKLADFILKEAGLSYSEMDKLQQMPWKQYYEFATRALAKYRQEQGLPALGGGGGFAPVVDGFYLPQHPYYKEPAPSAAEVPMLICSTMNEQSPSRTDPSLEKIDLQGVKEKLRERFREKTDAIVESYARTFPDKRPIEIWSMVISNRQNAIALADAKARQSAPVYLTWFGWQPPLFDNRLRAFHCIDICFWFYNTDLMLTHTGGGARPKKLSAKMADTLVNFMRTGNPNNAGLPVWPAYSQKNGETMLLDDICVVKNNPDRDARQAFL